MSRRSRTAPALLAAAALAGLAACGSGMPFGGGDDAVARASGKGQVQPSSADGRTAWSGNLAATDTELFVTARDDTGWRGLWEAVGTAPPVALPRGSMAVAVFLGQRPTGGYAVEIAGVERRGDATVVLYRETTPAPGVMTTQMLTAPYAVKLVEDSGLPVRYQPVD